MARRLEIIFEGGRSLFTSCGIDRKSLHGFRRRIALDADGNECETAYLTRDGRFLLAKGCTAGLYLDEAGEVVERKDLLAANVAGNDLDGFSLARRRTQSRAEPTTLDEFLDHVFVTAHSLMPELVDPALDEALHRGDVFRLFFDDEAMAVDQPSFLLANRQGIFLLEMQHCGFEHMRLEQPIIEADELSTDDAGDEFAFDLEWEAADEPA